MHTESPIYSHNPYHHTRFPLLVLNTEQGHCSPPNEGFRVLHWHEEIQFIFVLKGKIQVKVYEEAFELGEGDCIYINHTALHITTELTSDHHYHSYIIPPQMVSFFPGSAMEQENVNPIIYNPAFTCYPIRRSRPEHAGLLRQLRILDALYFQKEASALREYQISVQLSRVWLAFLSLHPLSRSTAPSRNYERIRTLLSVVHTDYSRPLTIEELADAAHISKTECLRCFRRYTGDSPYQYLMKYRLHVSCSLLRTTEKTVTDIALSTGFRSASSYIQYFKKYYGVTPYQYRKQEEITPAP
ncbi:MAG TPA: helix-turn-helix domain-containing protein [Candidatus Blautia gallistercoris]|uniref:Helix-turn-helix domain-containing protein n=1 Tax=Candidatus Blautia gallistercoris TaxID=2838490 RepID=A0A9D2B4V1_9FIRM|nr:helix-turn-helix domain-containing protein [Candidatus Blautia gallistercoris]